MDKIAELVKAGKIREISDMRDETVLNGVKLTLDLKRGVDQDKLMDKLYKVRLAELEDGKVAQMGIFVPGRLGMDEGETILDMVLTADYSGHMLFFFAYGQCAAAPRG